MHQLISKINAYFLPLTEARNLIQSAQKLYQSLLLSTTSTKSRTSLAGFAHEEVNAGFKSHFEPELVVLRGYVMIYFLAALGRKSLRLLRLSLPVLSFLHKIHF